MVRSEYAPYGPAFLAGGCFWRQAVYRAASRMIRLSLKAQEMRRERDGENYPFGVTTQLEGGIVWKGYFWRMLG